MTRLPIILLFLLCTYTSYGQQQPLGLLLINGQQLLEAKSGNSALYQPAIKNLLREADKLLTLTPVSVMDKQAVAASGDKHDYYSQARYWFADPTKVDGLPYIRKDGVNNPDIKALDREPLAKMGRSVSILALAYYLSNQQQYADKAWQLLRVWYLDKKTRMNPHMNYGQVVLGRDNNMGRSEGVLDTYSMVQIVDAVTLLTSSSRHKKGELEGLRSWFSNYLQWMLSSPIAAQERAMPNNHGVAFDIQVVTYAIFTSNREVALEYIHQFKSNRIEKQIEPDGRQPKELARTTSFGYSVFNLTHFLDMVQIAQSQGIDILGSTSDGVSLIEKGIDYLTPYLGAPVTAWPYQQIRDWDKVQQSLCWVLYRADRHMPHKGYKALFQQHNKAKSSDRNWLIY